MMIVVSSAVKVDFLLTVVVIFEDLQVRDAIELFSFTLSGKTRIK